MQEQCVLMDGKKSDYALGIVPGMYRGLKTISHNGALFERWPNGGPDIVEMESIVAHELCHVRRRDNLATVIHMVVEVVFWFHPLVWWLGAQLIEERERACDEEVLRSGGEPRAYAEGILKICELYLASPIACVAGVTGGDLKRRIEAIMSNRVASRLNYARKAILATAATAAVMTPLIVGIARTPAIWAQASSSAQSATTARFEVASIKRCNDIVAEGGRGGGGTGTGPSSPGRLDLPCQPVRSFIRVAYIRANFRATGEDNLQLEGGPAWIDSERYQIIAKADGPASLEGMEGLMLQRLLENRFQLKVHREARESRIYALRVAKGGLKMKPSTPGSCIDRDPADTSFRAPAAGEKPYCGEAGIATAVDRVTFSLASGTIKQLALNIGGRLGGPVVDQTAVAEKFDFHLEFARDGIDPSDTLEAPSLLTARGELGLKVESAEGPREFLVIDHIERPSEN
jgi:bla regulator protein BlaR1